MSFLQHECNSKQSQIEKFPTYVKNITPTQKYEKLSCKKCVVRRMSLPFLPEFQGSMTVEAALVLPMFLFFVLNLLSVIEMLRFHGNLTWALNEVGGNLAIYGHIYEDVIGDKDQKFKNELGEVAFSYLYIREKLEEVLGESTIKHSPVVDGLDGILFSKTEIMEKDVIDLVLTYRMEMPFSLGKTRVYHCYYARGWTGYDVTGNKKEGEGANGELDCVYVTEYGTVYHGKRSCSHLELSIRSVNVQDIELLRNKDGERYDRCLKCSEGNGDFFYVTEYGDKYHEDSGCSGLKRVILEISLQEAKECGYSPCFTCWKE